MGTFLGYLSLARKANLVEIGEAKAKEAAASGRAKLFIAGSDCSEPTIERIQRLSERYDVPLCTGPLTKDELFDAVGKAGCMAAFTDEGLALAFIEALSADKSEYLPQAEILRSRKKAAPAPSASAAINKGKRKHR